MTVEDDSYLQEPCCSVEILTLQRFYFEKNQITFIVVPVCTFVNIFMFCRLQFDTVPFNVATR